MYGEQIISCLCFQLSVSREEAINNCQTYIDARLLVQQGSRLGGRFKPDAVYCLTQKGAFALSDIENSKIKQSEELSDLYTFSLKTSIFYLEKTPNGKFSISFNLASIMFRNFVIELESENSEGAKVNTPTIKERIFALKKRGKNSFLGSEAVDWVLDHCSVINREEATIACANFSTLGWIAATSTDEKTIKDGSNLYQITPQGLSVAESLSEPKELISPENNEKFDNFVSTHVLTSKREVPDSSSAVSVSEKKVRPVSMSVSGTENPAENAKLEPLRSRRRSMSISNPVPPSILNSSPNPNAKPVLKPFVIETSQETGGARLNQILVNPQLCEAFGEYLKQSYCHENLAFWMDIELFRQNFQIRESAVTMTQTQDQPMLVPHAIAIYKKYIVMDSPFEVNIVSNIKNEIQALMEKVKDCFSLISDITVSSSDLIQMDELLHGVSISQFPVSLEGFSGNMFSSAHSHIFRLMATDSVPKFMKTTSFKTLVNILKLDFFNENSKYTTSSDRKDSVTSITRNSVNQTPKSNLSPTNQLPSEIQSSSMQMKVDI
ncbi:hypothetical protein HK096_005851 [Nowakowskiella sp. JEL0078]|nr:hypothetical protein HK096_005851 [Nowakowskiella sp. JEL0078]